uniref:Serpentine receptor class gamma n=1 Tax=Heterorhabditis bacteriophora TaxID=37862 RepID=A0A1I7WVC4_HETBA
MNTEMCPLPVHNISVGISYMVIPIMTLLVYIVIFVLFVYFLTGWFLVNPMIHTAFTNWILACTSYIYIVATFVMFAFSNCVFFCGYYWSLVDNNIWSFTSNLTDMCVSFICQLITLTIYTIIAISIAMRYNVSICTNRYERGILIQAIVSFLYLLTNTITRKASVFLKITNMWFTIGLQLFWITVPGLNLILYFNC